MKNKLLVIASYPEKDKTHGQSTVGVASYTKNTLLALPKDTQITVLAEQLPTTDYRLLTTDYTEDNITIKRIWKRGSIFTFPKLLYAAYSSPAKHVLIAFELSMFGGALSLLFFPIFLFILKLIGKETTVVTHQVIDDIKELSGHIAVYKPGIKASIQNFFIRSLYKLILSIASKCIVFDQVLADRLAKHNNSKKIIVIPHGVEHFADTTTKQKARKALNIPQDAFVVLYFGYIAYYKGTDLLLQEVKSQKSKVKNMELIIAGGANPNHLSNPTYMSYVQSIEQEAKKNNIQATGFVPQEKIPLYYQASDVVVLPYRTFMSASGPLSIAFSFEKPFLLSKPLSSTLKTYDMQTLMQQTELTAEDLTFSQDDPYDLARRMADKQLLAKTRKLSAKLKEVRSWKQLGPLYEKAIFQRTS